MPKVTGLPEFPPKIYGFDSPKIEQQGGHVYVVRSDRCKTETSFRLDKDPSGLPILLISRAGSIGTISYHIRDGDYDFSNILDTLEFVHVLLDTLFSNGEKMIELRSSAESYQNVAFNLTNTVRELEANLHPIQSEYIAPQTMPKRKKQPQDYKGWDPNVDPA